MLLRFISLTIVCLGLASCIGLKPSPNNTKIYALGLPDSIQNSPSVSVARGYIARPQLPVYMEGHGLKLIADNREIIDTPNARWAESLDMGIARAISCYIETLSGGLKSDFYPWTRTREATFTLQLNFHHLIATSDGRILIAADWNYKYSDGKVESGVFVNNTIEWSPNDAQSMVAGMNSALKLLAKEIAESLKKELLSEK